MLYNIVSFSLSPCLSHTFSLYLPSSLFHINVINIKITIISIFKSQQQIYIWPWLIIMIKAKAMHMSTMNFFKWWWIGQILLKQSNRMSCIGFRFTCVHLTLTHFEGHGQDPAHFYIKYLGNGDITFAFKYDGMYWLLIDISTFNLDPLLEGK